MLNLLLLFATNNSKVDITWNDDIIPLARDDNLPATFVTPCLTLSLTSSRSGGWYVELIPVISSLPNSSADEILLLPSKRERFDFSD